MQLIKDVATLKEFIGGVNKNMSEGTIMPYIEAMQTTAIEKYVGAEFVRELAAIETPDEVQAEVLRLLRRSLANYAMNAAAPTLIVSIGDGGLGLAAGKALPPQWAVDAMNGSLIAMADTFLESALAFLENNADAFPAWTGSSLYSVSKSLLISSATELNEVFEIGCSRRVFLVLRPYIKQAEDFYFDVVNQDIIATIKQQRISRQLTDENKDILAKIQPAIAYYALFLSFSFLPLKWIDGTLKIVNTDTGTTKKNTAETARLVPAQLTAKENADRYMAKLLQHLNNLNTEESEAPKPARERKKNTAGSHFRV